MLLEINGTFIFVFLSFIVFLALMNYICYKPINLIIKKREGLLYKNKETVDETNNKKQDVINKMDKELSDAEFEGSKILKETSDNCKLEKENSIKLKKEEIRTNLAEFENSVKESSNNIKNNLKDEIQNCVKLTVSKVLKVDYNDVFVDENKLNEILYK